MRGTMGIEVRTVPGPRPARPWPRHSSDTLTALARFQCRNGPHSETLGGRTLPQCSQDLRQTQAFLDHQRSDTTAIYLQQLTGEEHRHWQTMVNALGVGG